MPVTAKLSRNFYEKLGDDVANELVEWFNGVDATYKLELREIVASELKATRAELRQELAAESSKLRQELAAESSKLRQELAAESSKLRQELAAESAELRHEMVTGFANVRGEIAALRAELIKWSFVFFATAALAVIGLR